ncbi:MAG: DUF6017 domain-containing protein [Lachnospiraceae bacterium]|nr:DUF6017 domain-containing protein [Lachnospiraceae bacterium]
MDEIFKLLNPNNTVTINRPLAHALGLIEAVIYSALIGKQSYYDGRNILDDDGYFYSTISDLQESTGLSRYQQDGAIKHLAETGLIECCKKGMPARRFFRVNGAVELLKGFLQRGVKIMQLLNPHTGQNSTSVCGKLTDQFGENSQTSLGKTCKHTYNLNNKSKIINPNQSIVPDGIDRIDNSIKRCCSLEKRAEYLQLIRENIEYDYQTEKEKVDELVEIMLDVVCSTSETVRVNGEDMLQEVVKSRFLKLGGSHIDYVLTSLKKTTSDVKNMRAYLITTLYNAPTTINSYYTAWVNHDMYG